jgi:hypothetical protein
MYNSRLALTKCILSVSVSMANYLRCWYIICSSNNLLPNDLEDYQPSWIDASQGTCLSMTSTCIQTHDYMNKKGGV